MGIEIALVVGFSLILALLLAGIALAYSHYIYSRNRIFSKTKLSVLWIIITAFMAVFMLITGILFAINTDFVFWPVYVGLSFTCFVLCVGYLLYFVLVPKLTNKNKISYEQLLKVNYQEKIKELLSQINDFESYKSSLLNNHPKYYETMLSYYESILNRAKNSQITLVEKMADIVTFNDAFTHKWSTFTNYYQIYLTFKFCEILQKIS